MPTNDSDYKPRLSVDLSPELAERLKRLVPWGLNKLLFTKVTEQLLDIIEKHGEIAIGAFLSGRVSIIELLEGREHEREPAKKIDK